MKRFVMYAALAADLMNGSDAFGASPVFESETANPIELGYKWITLITPTLFRLEYAENQEFLGRPRHPGYKAGAESK